MNAMTTRIIAVVAAAVLLVGAGVFVLNSKNKTSNQAAPTSSPTASPQTNSGAQTIVDLFTSGGNKKCTFSANGSSGGNTSGTFYVSSANVRGDMIMTDSKGKTQNMHIIRMGDESYIWGDAVPGGSGIKMKLSAQEFANNSQVQQSFNSNEKTNFNCTDSSAPASMFVLPTNVKFMDMGAITPPSSAPNSSPAAGTMGSQCAACNALSGDQKASCLAIYHCQ